MSFVPVTGAVSVNGHVFSWYDPSADLHKCRECELVASHNDVMFEMSEEIRVGPNSVRQLTFPRCRDAGTNGSFSEHRLVFDHSIPGAPSECRDCNYLVHFTFAVTTQGTRLPICTPGAPLRGGIPWVPVSPHAFGEAYDTPVRPRLLAPAKPKCTACARELSAYLDAYYGKDEHQAKRCAGCRGRGDRGFGTSTG